MARRLTIDEFIGKAKIVHGDKFTYSNITYRNGVSFITIICPIHGEFEQRASSHLEGKGCMKCAGKNRQIGVDLFLNRAKLVHGDKFDYSLITDYKECKAHLNVICKKHGSFKISADHHINRGQGCPKCKLLGLDGFINKANKIHDNKYSYSNVIYINNKTNVDIKCPIHGEFNQRVTDHLRGSGCPVCAESKGEREIGKILTDRNITFIKQYRFPNCKYKRSLPFDFYLPEFNICIEFNGRQHYEPVTHFGGNNQFITQERRDKIKTLYCLNNNIPLIVIKHDDNIFKKLSTLFDRITIITQSLA